MTQAAEFYGNDPEDIWDEGYNAAKAGRSMDTNPFRTGEAKRSHELGAELAARQGVMPGEGGSFYVPDEPVQLTDEQNAEIRKRQEPPD